MLKRILLALTAVALVIGTFALPVLAQEEEGSEEETPSCAELVENVQRYLSDYAVGKITVGEAANRVAEEVEDAVADGVMCSGADLQKVARTPGARDVAELLSTRYAPPK